MIYNEYSINDICTLRNQKINTSELKEHMYISTDNMVPEKGGLEGLSNLPSNGKVNSFKEEDTLISNIRPYFKKIWFSNFEGGCSPDVLVFNAKRNLVLPKYLFYFLSQDTFFDYMVKTSKGTKMPRGDKNAILQYPISLPELDYQKRVVAVLTKLDKKIEINQKMIVSLEELSKALFKQWFIEFDFPNDLGIPYKSSGGKLVESALGKIPENWECKNLVDICEVKDGTHDSPKQVDDGFPLVTSKHLKKNNIDFSTTKLISYEDYEKVNKRSLVERYDILISMIGTVGRLYFVHDEEINFAIKNIGLIKTSQITYFEYIYCYMQSDSMKKYIVERMTGSTQQYISLAELRKIPVLMPTKVVLERFKDHIDYLFKMIYTKTIENHLLKDMRDSLLTKLLSGEIEIPDESVDKIYV